MFDSRENYIFSRQNYRTYRRWHGPFCSFVLALHIWWGILTVGTLSGIVLSLALTIGARP